MATTTFKPGDEVRTHIDRYENSWGEGVMTVEEVYPSGIVVCLHPELGSGGFKPEQLTLVTPTFRPGDVVEAADGRPYGELGAVVHVSKKGRWVTVQYEDGVKSEWLASELRLSYRPATAEEMLAESEELRAKMVRGIEQEKSNRIAAQYANDQALLAAGLVRVDLLKQWAPTFTERTREPQYALLQRLRSVLAAPNENKEQA